MACSLSSVHDAAFLVSSTYLVQKIDLSLVYASPKGLVYFTSDALTVLSLPSQSRPRFLLSILDLAPRGPFLFIDKSVFSTDTPPFSTKISPKALLRSSI